MKTVKRMIALVLIMLMIVSIASMFMGCSSSDVTPSGKVAKCGWCNGTGSWAYYDSKGDLHYGKCSHCGGTGRSPY